jgi:hypothetical protein
MWRPARARPTTPARVSSASGRAPRCAISCNGCAIRGDLLIDLNDRGNPEHPPLFTPGTYYTLQDDEHVVPGRTFDLLVYLERSPAMTPLRFAVCQ